MSLRIFIAAWDLPKPDRNAGDRRFFALLEMLARYHHVHLWVESISSNLSTDHIGTYCHNLKAVGVRLLRPGWKSFATALAKTHYDIGFFELYRVAERNASDFRDRQPGAKIIIDSVDVHFAREGAGAEFGVIDVSQADETRRKELAAYRTADAVIVVTDDDERILRAEGDMSPLFLLPIVMPVHPRTPGTRQPELLFIAGFDHPPNLDGLRWFVKDIWLRVHEEVPDARLTIIGSNTPAEVEAFGTMNGIQVLGFVEDTTSHLDRAAISIAPLRYGAGMKGKVVEAMSYGLPVVTTSVGMQGINAVSGEHCLIADNAAEFAEALITLLKDPQRAQEIGLAGQDHIAGLCSPERVELALEEMLKKVVPHRRSVKDWLRWRGFHAMLAVRIVARQITAVSQKILYRASE
jgi:glycosyltransferase involved in cell wall biosynthesis